MLQPVIVVVCMKAGRKMKLFVYFECLYGNRLCNRDRHCVYADRYQEQTHRLHYVVGQDIEQSVHMCTDTQSPQNGSFDLQLAPVSSPAIPWSAEIEFNCSIDITRRNILPLCAAFKQGIDFSVVEEMVCIFYSFSVVSDKE